MSKHFGLNCPFYYIHKSGGGMSSQQIADAWRCDLDLDYCAIL